MTELSEDALIRRCQQGSRRAWEQFLDAHWEPVGRFLFQQSSEFSLEDVERLSFEVFETATREIREFRGGSKPRTWLLRLAMQAGRALIEERRKSGTGEAQSAPSNDGRDEEFEHVRRILDRMKGPCRDMIELRFFGDLELRELAAESGVTTKTIEGRLPRCLHRVSELSARIP